MHKQYLLYVAGKHARGQGLTFFCYPYSSTFIWIILIFKKMLMLDYARSNTFQNNNKTYLIKTKHFIGSHSGI